MNNKKIIAQYLLDLAKESKSEFIEISKDSELIDVAKKMNLVIPSPDIAILKTIYAQTDVPNLNKIVLPKEAVKKALPTLVGKQANWSHKGKNFICGWILDAKLEKDLIIIYVAIFKSLFIEEFDTVKQMFEDNKLSCSFEIWNSDENNKTVLHELGDGNRSIDPILFHGVGILIEEDEKPACPKAYALKLLAKFNIDGLSEKIENKVFEENLICASMAIAEPKCNKCNPCTCNKEEKIVNIDKEIVDAVIANAKLADDQENAKKPKDGDTCDMGDGKMGEMHIDKDGKSSCIIPEAHKKMHEEMNNAVEVKEEVVTTPEIVAAETKAEVIAPAAETKPEIIADVATSASDATTVTIEVTPKAEEATVITTTQEVKEVVTYVDNTSVVETESKVAREVVGDDGSKSTETQETKQVTTYTYEQMQAEVAKVKVELEKKLLEKDNELASLKELIEKTKVEKETEIANLKTELETAKKPIEIATVESADLTVGRVTEVATEDKYVALRKSIDIKAFGKKG